MPETLTDQPEGGIPATTKSTLGSLRDRRAEIVDFLFEDFAVPRWTKPKIYVRYHPVAIKEIEKASQRAQELQTSQRANRAGRRAMAGTSAPVALIDITIDLLVQADPGVYAMIDGFAYTLDAVDHWVPVECDEDNIPVPEAALCGFDPVILGGTLTDEPIDSVRQLVKTLYIVDGDIIQAGNDLGAFSGYGSNSADQAVLGE